jgi:glycosyltransferase involved in cell wall biosynthesis
VPNGVDVERLAPIECPPQPGRMVFTGAMDWLPNADATVFFVEQILPRIRKRLPSAHVRLVGRNPDPALVRRLTGPGVDFTGTVEDVRPELAAAALVVVPLRIGSGTRLKILEAWAMGKAVLSTSIGAEGLPAVDRESIILADTPEAFTDRAVELLEDRERSTALGVSGRRVALEGFSWKRIARNLVAAYEGAVVAHRQRLEAGRVP